MKKYLILLLIIFLTPFQADAIDEIKAGDTLSIEECIELAVKNSPLIKIYEQQLKIMETQTGKAKADYFPSISASAGYNYGNDDNKYGSNQSKNTSARVSLNQLIFSFGKVLSKVKMQKFYKIAAEYDLQNAVLETSNNVRSAYYGVLAAKADVEIQRADVLVNERQYNRTKAFFDEGLVSKIDLVNEEVYLSNAEINLINAENAYDNAVINLNNAMYITDAPEYNIQNTETFNFKNNFAEINLINVANTSSGGKIEPKDAVLTTQVEKTDILENYKFEKYPYTLKESIEKAYQNRPDLLAMQAAENAAKEALVYAKRSYLPDLTASAGYNFHNNSHYDTNSVSLGITLASNNINIAKTRLDIKENKARLEIAKQNTELIKKNINYEVQSAYTNMIQLEKNLPLIKTKINQALENYELADARYEEGLGNFIELQDAKENYNNAQREYVQTIYRYNTALSALKTAMGEK